MTKNKKSSHYSLRCMMNNRRLNKTKRRSICSNLPVKTILLATMLFFFAISRTTTTVDSFIPRANNHRSTKKSIAGHAKHSPLPTSTSLGYEDDKSFDTNVDSPSPVPRKDASSATVVTERKEKSSCPFLPSVKKSESPSKARVNIRYRGTWYDVTNFRKAHSAGPHWLDWFDGRDATEIIDGLHSTHSRKMATRLPKVKPEVSAELEAKAAPDSKVQLNFRQLFDQMLRDGWWERNMHFEYQQLGIWASLVLGAAATVQVAPYISFVLLALSFTGAGWLGHDYVHGLDPFAKSLRLFLPLTTGLSPRWWSDKHNKHHALSKSLG